MPLRSIYFHCTLDKRRRTDVSTIGGFMLEGYEGLEELPLLDQMDIYRHVLRIKQLRGTITLPEMAMMTCLDEWLHFASIMLHSLAA